MGSLLGVLRDGKEGGSLNEGFSLYIESLA